MSGLDELDRRASMQLYKDVEHSVMLKRKMSAGLLPGCFYSYKNSAMMTGWAFVEIIAIREARGKRFVEVRLAHGSKPWHPKMQGDGSFKMNPDLIDESFKTYADRPELNGYVIDPAKLTGRRFFVGLESVFCKRQLHLIRPRCVMGNKPERKGILKWWLANVKSNFDEYDLMANTNQRINPLA